MDKDRMWRCERRWKEKGPQFRETSLGGRLGWIRRLSLRVHFWRWWWWWWLCRWQRWRWQCRQKQGERPCIRRRQLRLRYRITNLINSMNHESKRIPSQVLDKMNEREGLASWFAKRKSIHSLFMLIIEWRMILTMLSLCTWIQPVALFKISRSTQSSVGSRRLSLPWASNEMVWKTRYIDSRQNRHVKTVNREYCSVPGIGSACVVVLTVTCGCVWEISRWEHQ